MFSFNIQPPLSLSLSLSLSHTHARKHNTHILMLHEPDAKSFYLAHHRLIVVSTETHDHFVSTIYT